MSRLPAIVVMLAALAGCVRPLAPPAAPDQRALLVGPVWVAEDSKTTLVFYADRRLVGKAACGSYIGRYRIDGAALTVGEVKAGASGCAAQPSGAQQSYLAALASVVRYDVQPEPIERGGALVLIAADGRQLRFHRDPAPAIQALTYACDDGSSLRVLFDWKNGSASVAANEAATTSLAQIGTLSGFRFEAPPRSFSGIGDTAQWSENGAAPVACRVTG